MNQESWRWFCVHFISLITINFKIIDDDYLYDVYRSFNEIIHYFCTKRNYLVAKELFFLQKKRKDTFFFFFSNTYKIIYYTSHLFIITFFFSFFLSLLSRIIIILKIIKKKILRNEKSHVKINFNKVYNVIPHFVLGQSIVRIISNSINFSIRPQTALKTTSSHLLQCPL